MVGQIQISLWWFLALLEVLLLVAAWELWRFWKRRRQVAEGGGEVAPEAIDRWLERQIEEVDRTMAALQQHQGGAVSSDVLRQRRAWLQAELGARRAAREHGRDFWLEYAHRVPVRDRRRDERRRHARERERNQQLARQLEALQQRLNNLERFRDLFFEMKGRLADSRSLNVRLQHAVEQHLPREQRPRELTELLERLEKENRRLASEMAEVESTLDEMLRTGPEQAPEPASLESFSALSSSMGQRLLALRRNYARQAELIQELRAQLQEVTGLDAGRPFREVLDELEEARLALKEQVVRLEDENEFLSRQISMLLHDELERAQVHEQELALLEERLRGKEEALSQSEARLAEMERKYLELHAELSGGNGG